MLVFYYAKCAILSSLCVVCNESSSLATFGCLIGASLVDSFIHALRSMNLDLPKCFLMYLMLFPDA